MMTTVVYFGIGVIAAVIALYLAGRANYESPFSSDFLDYSLLGLLVIIAFVAWPFYLAAALILGAGFVLGKLGECFYEKATYYWNNKRLDRGRLDGTMSSDGSEK